VPEEVPGGVPSQGARSAAITPVMLTIPRQLRRARTRTEGNGPLFASVPAELKLALRSPRPFNGRHLPAGHGERRASRTSRIHHAERSPLQRICWPPVGRPVYGGHSQDGPRRLIRGGSEPRPRSEINKRPVQIANAPNSTRTSASGLPRLSSALEWSPLKTSCVVPTS
jgi:hypothetical protein